MLLPLLPHVAILALDPEPGVPQLWRVVYAQHLGMGRYQWLATALACGRTRAQARAAARATAARLSQHIARHGLHHHAGTSPLLAPFVPISPLL